MSIVADIKRAKALFDDHVAVHGCRPAAAIEAEGGEPCTLRIALWLEYQDVAGRWGREPDDDRRQREHYDRNVKRAAA